jgi:hypothetical protein
LVALDEVPCLPRADAGGQLHALDLPSVCGSAGEADRVPLGPAVAQDAALLVWGTEAAEGGQAMSAESGSRAHALAQLIEELLLHHSEAGVFRVEPEGPLFASATVTVGEHKFHVTVEDCGQAPAVIDQTRSDSQR